MANFELYQWEAEQLGDNQPDTAVMVAPPKQRGVQLVPAQQFSDFFAAEQFFQSEDVEESRHFCVEQFAYERREVSVAQLSVDKHFALSVNDQEYQMTEKAYGDLCRLLHIPLAFAYDIPTDLTATIVQRLKADHQQSVVVVSRGDTIVSVIDPLKWATGRGEGRMKKNPLYLPVSNLDLLHLLEKVWNGPNVDTRITLSDSGMQVELLLQEESFTVEPTVGDVTRVGIAITNSETGGPLPLARGYTLRLVCTNGSTVQTDPKLYRFSSDLRCSLDWRFTKFGEGLQKLMQEMRDMSGTLQTAYRRMAEEELDDDKFYNFYRRAQYLSRGIANSSEQIDTMFGVTTSQRKDLFTQVRDRQNTRRDGITAGIDLPQSTGLLTYNVFNGITAAARDEVRYHRRIGLEGLAGDVVRKYLQSDN